MSDLTEPQLTFTEMSETNRTRCARWHHAETEKWTLADWSNALCGEAGELANVIKKLRRAETGTQGPKDPPVEVLREKAKAEIADVQLYLDLVANALGFNLPECIVPKFNLVSEEQGFPERLAL